MSSQAENWPGRALQCLIGRVRIQFSKFRSWSSPMRWLFSLAALFDLLSHWYCRYFASLDRSMPDISFSITTRCSAIDLSAVCRFGALALSIKLVGSLLYFARCTTVFVTMCNTTISNSKIPRCCLPFLVQSSCPGCWFGSDPCRCVEATLSNHQ